jgi:hypothetical protein
MGIERVDIVAMIDDDAIASMSTVEQRCRWDGILDEHDGPGRDRRYFVRASAGHWNRIESIEIRGPGMFAFVVPRRDLPN